MKRLLYILVLLPLLGYSQQDALYSQYMNNRLSFNPAFAGSIDAISNTILMRNQWIGFDGAPLSFALTSHGAFKLDKINVGLALTHDRIGLTQNTGIFGNYAYRLDLDFGRLAFGVDAGFNLHRRVWEEADAIDGNDEAFIGNVNSVFLPNIGLGAYLENELYYVGISAPRLLENRIKHSGVSTTNAKLNRHYYLTGGIDLQVTRDIQFQPSILLKYVPRAPVELDITPGILIQEAVWIGTSFRTGDAFVLILQYNINDHIQIGYASDFAYTGISNYNNGTHEIMFKYEYSKTRTFRSKY